MLPSSRCKAPIIAAIALGSGPLVQAMAAVADAAPSPEQDADRYSRAFLGAYRNILDIDELIVAACQAYGVDPNWARAICMYESGGNPDLSSHMGAQGYFQVMPRTYRTLHVSTNIEAGVKYLAEMYARYGREDYATAAYNGGPLFVDRDRAFKLETLQYVIGVGHFRSVLEVHEPEVRLLAKKLAVHRVAAGDTWWSISQKTGIPIMELRMYNPFFAHRGTLEEGNRIVHASAPGPPCFKYEDGVVRYRVRIGDNPLWVGFVYDVGLDDFRAKNRLWRLQSLPEGAELQIDLRRGSDYKDYVVQPADTLLSLAGGSAENVWDLVKDAGLFDQKLVPGSKVRIWLGTTTPTIEPEAVGASAAEAPPDKPSRAERKAATVYRVKRGDTIFSIAQSFGTTVDEIRRLNGLRRRNHIWPGQKLKVPAAAEVGG